MFDTFRKTFHLVGRDNPGRWVALVAGAVVVSVLEMLGAVLIYLLLALLADSGGTLDTAFLGYLPDSFSRMGQTRALLVVAAILGVFFLGRAGIMIGYTYIKHRLAQNAAARLSSRLARGYLHQPYAFHLHRSSAELVRNAHQSVEVLGQTCFLAAIQVIAESLVVLGLVAVMVVVAPLATAMAVAIVGTSALALLWIVQPRLRSLGAAGQEMRKLGLASLQQSLHGVRDIKILGVEEHFAHEYASTRAALSRSLYARGTLLELPRLIIETSLVAFILVLLGLSLGSGNDVDQILSTLGLFAYAGLRLQPSLQKVVSGLNSVRYAAPAVEQLHEDLALIEGELNGAHEPIAATFSSSLKLENVNFTYETATAPALIGANLEILPGQLIGICGPSGGGKTTLIDLLAGILDPSQGRVTVDGVDVRECRQSWFRRIGAVPQMIFLIDDTLRRNVALGARDDDIDEQALREAIRLAQLEPFVASLPYGLDTVVGERGVRISGGQRQRIAIARALYRGPDVVMLDEGTAALDPTTEAALISALEALRDDHTIILVAHRLSTVRNCDLIVYVEGGRIAGVGTFEQLRAENANFRGLAANA